MYFLVNSLYCLICFLLLTFTSQAHSVLGSSSRPSFVDINSNSSFHPESRWIKSTHSEREAIKKLIQVLEQSQTGKNLLLRAKRQVSSENRDLLSLIQVGETSMLDTTLIRRFARHDPSQISYHTRSMIFINRNHNVRNAVLDLAHELTHFIYRENFNPYDLNFTASEFVANTVEGKGGEADAYMVECQVLREMYPQYFEESSQCHRIVDDRGNLSKDLAVDHFYRIGSYVQKYQEKLKKFKSQSSALEKVSDKQSQFISSAWGLPYPVAALKEYETIMERVCENDEKRLSLMANSSESRSQHSRTPASKRESIYQDEVFHTMAAHRKRCELFLP